MLPPHRTDVPGAAALAWSPARRWPWATAVAAGCVALLVRPLLPQSTWRTPALLVLFAGLLAAGLAWRAPAPAPAAAALAARPLVRGDVAFAVGLAAFALGRVLGGGHPPHAAVATAIVLNAFAAVAEEAFFRRLLYGVLAPRGALVAVAGSAVAFAAVHVTVYGAWVLPVDLAAGLVLSWQRWATGSWLVPAATHVLANVMVVM